MSMDSYGIPGIDEIIGPLRKRVGSMIAGDFSRTNTSERNYQGIETYAPFTNILTYVHNFEPELIIKKLTPILEELQTITPSSLDHLKNRQSEFSPASDYELITDEITYYEQELNSIINRYRQHQPGSIQKRKVLTYRRYNEPGGRVNLTNLRQGLSNYIDDIPDVAFQTIFSGQHQVIDRKINWNNSEKFKLRYFLSELFKHEQIGDNNRVDWEVVSNCFLFNGNIIDNDFRTNTRLPSSSFRDEVSRILSNL